MDEKELTSRYRTGNCTEQEKLRLEHWFHNLNKEEKLLLSEAEFLDLKTEMWKEIEKRAPEKRYSVKLWPRIAAAAAIALIIGAGLFYYNQDNTSQKSKYANDVAPGKIGATLMLADGKKIKLTDAANGELAKESGVVITKAANGELTYEIKDQKEIGSGKINTLTTVNGETYKVKLPDGTLVWLNAASSLKYPSSFAALKLRKIELTGEAYFEVTKDKSHPFIVKTDRQEVEVLGTHFNINSYADEPAVKTTLVEGSVKVISKLGENLILKPDQQASVINSGSIKVQDIDAELAVAWKNNLLIFEDHDIQFIMRTLERWYNVKVTYVGSIPEGKFGGATSKFEHVSKVLEILESTKKVHFKIEGRNIQVSK